MPTRAENDPAGADAAMSRADVHMARADEDLSEAVAALEEAEDDPHAEADTVNRLDAEVSRLRDQYREAEEEHGRVQDNWFKEEVNNDEDEVERLSVNDAAEIWLSRGMDEGDTFGYSEEDLRRALGQG